MKVHPDNNIGDAPSIFILISKQQRISLVELDLAIIQAINHS